MGKRQVQGINVSTPLVLPPFDLKVTSFQKVEVTGKIYRKSSSSLPMWFQKTFLEPRGQDDPAQ